MIIDLIVHHYLSPRIIEVPAPVTDVSVQDLVDSIRAWEDSTIGQNFPYLVDAGGKEDLGGSTSVGITATLRNARIMFTARGTPIDNGAGRTCDLTDPLGTHLYVDDADFVSLGIYEGCTVFNSTTGDMATVNIVEGATALHSFPLSGGMGGGWTSGDSYAVYPNVQCTISGGNLVAVDGDGNTIPPVLQTPNVQIDRTASSSATLQDQEALQFSSYGGGVSVDTNSTYTGTDYPTGNQEYPVNNITDARIIALIKGFSTFFIKGNISLNTGDDISNFKLIGENASRTQISIADGAVTNNCEIQEALVTGILDNGIIIKDSIIQNLTYLDGVIIDTMINPGTITLGNNAIGHFLNCFSGVPGSGTPIIDMGGSGQALTMRNYNGGIKLINKSGAEAVSIDLNSGQVILDSTITNGTIVIRGIGKLTDNSVDANVLADDILNKDNIASALLETDISTYSTLNTVAHILQEEEYSDAIHLSSLGTTGTTYPVGTHGNPVNNLDDAKILMTNRGYKKLHIMSDWTFVNGDVLIKVVLEGMGFQITTVTFEAGSLLQECHLKKIRCTGTVVGIIGFEECHIDGLGSVSPVPSALDVVAKNCLIQGTVSLPSNYTGTLYVLDCWAVPDSSNNPPILDMGDGNFDLQMRNYSGFIKITNCTEANDVRIFLNSGGIVLDSTVTDGDFLITGVGTLVDNSTGTTINTDGLMSRGTITEIIASPAEIADAVLDESVSDHIGVGTVGLLLQDLHDEATGKWIMNPNDNTMTLYREDGITVLKVFDLTPAIGDVPSYIERTPQ